MSVASKRFGALRCNQNLLFLSLY